MIKKEIVLNEKEMDAVCELHKEMMESYAIITEKYNNAKSFEIFAVAIALTISNTLSSLGINNVQLFFNDMVRVIQDIHGKVKASSDYIKFRDGKKTSEGRFN